MSVNILTIDQGTSSTRAIIFDGLGQIKAQSQKMLTSHFPNNGWVEQDPEQIWQDVSSCCHEVIELAQLSAQDITCLGITNQRETTLVWDRQTGQVIAPAIVWEDRRTALLCEQLAQSQAVADDIQKRTGLLLDPYFSATKISWLLDNVSGARASAQQGRLAFGTIDSFILWRLTNGAVHATDATNASRTLLYNIQSGEWDAALLRLFNIPAEMLPQVCDSNAVFGSTADGVFDAPIQITGVLGDQQAAAFGQGCFVKGMVKSTYGTGCFMLMNTGTDIVYSSHKLLATIAYQIQGVTTYGLEGSIFVAGAAVQWLRDALHLIDHAKDTERLSQKLTDNGGVYFVPAFTGLGAPYWDPDARGAVIGLTHNSGIDHFVRAALESVCYQTRDLVKAMNADAGMQISVLRVDGGMVVNDWLLQFLADILDLRVERPVTIETTALGVAFMAGLGAGVYESVDEIAQLWMMERGFESGMPAKERDVLYQGWQQAVKKVRVKLCNSAVVF